MYITYKKLIHYVFVDDGCPNRINYYIHGLDQTFNHQNLQICFPISKDVAHDILEDMIDKIREGIVFRPGINYPEIIGGGFCIELKNAKECGRDVLRLVFPNTGGTYEGEIFAAQVDN